ncbi:Shedu immune nuclease family protein [Halorussus lipolyticus]|uniref:Shedu immune nuclease family protein n=1 Tax=Halorussus lipolyticus TaxID=3034024 RepID=UPI0023E79FA3|nr:Shedu immune nuclease family protein [Halorussus sp. DT80]
MKIEQDFGDGEVYEIDVRLEEKKNLKHISHYPLKSGPKTYKSLNVFSIMAKDEDKYLLSFWKARKKSSKYLNQVDETQFKCEKKEVTRLLDFLENLYELEGLDRGDHVILRKDSPSSEAAASAVEAIKSCDEELESVLLNLIGSLSDMDADISDLDLSENAIEQDAIRAEYAIKHARTKKKLEEFENLISDKKKERKYQSFLEDNPWLFGQEYVTHLDLRELTRDEEVDFCLESVDGYYDVIEIKTPSKTVLVEDGSHDTYKASADLSSAIAQVENYIHQIEANEGDILRRDKIHALKPRGIIVIGDELTDEKRESLRVLNSHLNRITVYTFSDIKRLGERMVSRYEQDGGLPTISPPK